MPQLPLLDVLYEDNHVLAVDKPAGLPTMGVAADKPSLLAIAKEYIRVKYDKPGNVYLGTLSRLDAPVTGVVIFARTSKAASRLTSQFVARTVEKSYWALVPGRVDPDEGQCIDWLRKDERHRKMHICQPTTDGAQEAILSYDTLLNARGHTLLKIALKTGRKHQIRLQLSHRGWPILGDRKYQSEAAFPAGIALHARQLIVEHPTQKQELKIEAPLPKSWRKWVSVDVERSLAEL